MNTAGSRRTKSSLEIRSSLLTSRETTVFLIFFLPKFTSLTAETSTMAFGAYSCTRILSSFAEENSALRARHNDYL